MEEPTCHRYASSGFYPQAVTDKIGTMIRKHLSAILILMVMAIAGTLATLEFRKMHRPEPLYPSPGLTKEVMLSDYFEGIKGTGGDTKVYLFDSGVPGGTALIGGGTHPNEAAAYLATVIFLENIKVTKGRIFIIPRLNNSGFTCTDPMEGYPQFFEIKTPVGARKFRLGARVTNPLHQWPDPLVFIQYPSNQQLSGFEARNINRAYPGRSDGLLTQKVAYGVIQLINKENINIAFDLHESSPEVPIVNVIVYHEKYEEIAMGAVLGLEMAGVQFSPELSPKNFHGLSHREWGDFTSVVPFLLETSNPSMGRLREKTNVELVLKGYSNNYRKARESGALRIAYREDSGEPIEDRVGRHIMGIAELIKSYNGLHAGQEIEFENLPDYNQIIEKGVGEFLHN